MSETQKLTERAPRALAAAALAALAVFLLAVPVAHADYEQVPEHFGEGQLEEALGIAVNERGEGGVAAGSFYVVTRGVFGDRFVLRYAPGGEGEEPAFREAWGWGVANHAQQYQRCGPAYEGSADPGGEHTFEACGFSAAGYPGEEKPGYFSELAAVAVDQATGYVYVLNVVAGEVREHHLIEVFTASGEYVGGFGDAGRERPAPSESIEEGPEKLHRMSATIGAIAVDEAGTVYVNDADYTGGYESGGIEHPQARVMSFEPCSPGEYDNYCYAGQAKDIVTEPGQAFFRIALSAGNRLVTANSELIRSYELGAGSTPLCSLAVSGQLQAMTANPLTGEVFYKTFSDRKIHRLGPCDPETGEYAELQEALKPQPVAKRIFALAVDPAHSWGPSRPPGILYAADYENAIGDVLVPAKVSPPEVLSTQAANATTTSATLRARIDPRGSATSYRFEYLSEAEYLANGESFEGPNAARRAPAADGLIASGEAATAAAPVSGLEPDTAYRFRVLAASRCEPSLPEYLCEGTGEAASFATYPVSLAVPPDSRAYELVSPAQKHGGEVFPADPALSSCVNSEGIPFDGECKPPGGGISAVFPMQSAPGGDAVSYMGFPFSPSDLDR